MSSATNHISISQPPSRLNGENISEHIKNSIHVSFCNPSGLLKNLSKIQVTSGKQIKVLFLISLFFPSICDDDHPFNLPATQRIRPAILRDCYFGAEGGREFLLSLFIFCFFFFAVLHTNKDALRQRMHLKKGSRNSTENSTVKFWTGCGLWCHGFPAQLWLAGWELSICWELKGLVRRWRFRLFQNSFASGLVVVTTWPQSAAPPDNGIIKL